MLFDIFFFFLHLYSHKFSKHSMELVGLIYIAVMAYYGTDFKNLYSYLSFIFLQNAPYCQEVDLCNRVVVTFNKEHAKIIS